MKRWNRRAQQRHRSKRPHKRFHPPQIVRAATLADMLPMPLNVNALRLHWQGDGWYEMAGGHRVES